MNNAFTIENETIHVSGALQLKQAPALLQQLTSLDVTNKIKHVNFSNTTDCDTTGILVMLRLERSAGKELQFINVPKRLQALLNLSSLPSRFNLQS